MEVSAAWYSMAIVTAEAWEGMPAEPDPLDMGPDTWRNPVSPHYNPLRVRKEQEEQKAKAESEAIVTRMCGSPEFIKWKYPGLPEGFTCNEHHPSGSVIITHRATGNHVMLREKPTERRELYEILYKLTKGEAS